MVLFGNVRLALHVLKNSISALRLAFQDELRLRILFGFEGHTECNMRQLTLGFRVSPVEVLCPKEHDESGSAQADDLFRIRK